MYLAFSLYAGRTFVKSMISALLLFVAIVVAGRMESDTTMTMPRRHWANDDVVIVAVLS